MNLRDFLNFRRMLTPVIIQVLFWLGTAASVFLGVIVLIGGLVSGIQGGDLTTTVGAFIGGPLIMVLGTLIVRIYSELLILAFRINETLTDIRDLLEED